MGSRKRIKAKGRKIMNPTAIELESKDVKDKKSGSFWFTPLNSTPKSFGQAYNTQFKKRK